MIAFLMGQIGQNLETQPAGHKHADTNHQTPNTALSHSMGTLRGAVTAPETTGHHWTQLFSHANRHPQRNLNTRQMTKFHLGR